MHEIPSATPTPAISPPREERSTGPPPPLLTAPPAELHPSCRAAYHYHANTLGVRQSPCKIAQPLFLALRFIHPTARPRSSYGVTLFPTRPSSHAVSTPRFPLRTSYPVTYAKRATIIITLRRWTFHWICAPRSWIASLIIYRVAWFARGSTDHDFATRPFFPSSFFLRVIGDHRWSSLSLFSSSLFFFIFVSRIYAAIRFPWKSRETGGTKQRGVRHVCGSGFFYFYFLSFFFFLHRRNGIVIFATRYATVVTKYCWRQRPALSFPLCAHLSIVYRSDSTLANVDTFMGAEAPGTRAPRDGSCFIFSVTGAGTRSLVRSTAFECLRREVVSPTRSSVFILQAWRDNICPRFLFHTYPTRAITPLAPDMRLFFFFPRWNSISPRSCLSVSLFFFRTFFPVNILVFPPLFFFFAFRFSMTVHRVAKLGREWIGSPSSLSSITFYLIVSLITILLYSLSQTIFTNF